MAAGGRCGAFHRGGGGAGAAGGLFSAPADWRQGAVSSAPDAGAADLRLCERRVLVASDRTGDVS